MPLDLRWPRWQLHHTASTIQNLLQSFCTAKVTFEDRTVYNKYEDKDSHFSAESLEMKKDSVRLPPVHLYCRLQFLVKIYRCNTRGTKRPLEDWETRKIRFIYVYEQVRAISTRNSTCGGRTDLLWTRIYSHSKLLTADDAEAAVSLLVCTTLINVSQRFWGLRGTTRYGPDSRYFFDLTEDGDQLSSVSGS